VLPTSKFIWFFGLFPTFIVN